MRTFLLIGTATLAGAALLAFNAFAGHDDDDGHHGKDITQTFDFKDFDRVSVSGVYEVDIEVGPSFSISLSGPEKEMDNVKVYTENGTLHLARKNKNERKKNNNQKGIDATITLPDLEGMKVSGVASGDITNVDAEDFDLKVSGVAEVEIEGSCNNLTARVSGVGELDAKDFECKDVDVTLSGVGEVTVFASESVDVKASGVGDVQVYGNPSTVSKKKAMFTNVTIK